MDDREYKRLKCLIIRSFFGLILLIACLVFFGSYQLKNLKSQLAAAKTPQIIKQTIVQPPENTSQPLQTVVGQTGANGKDGVGKNGLDGRNAQDISVDQIASAVANYLQANPPQKGDTGDAGKVVFVQQNILTGLWECKFADDTIWQPITECQ